MEMVDESSKEHTAIEVEVRNMVSEIVSSGMGVRVVVRQCVYPCRIMSHLII